MIERIYDHARAEGWLPPKSHVLDVFAGVALGALHALRLGCSWQGAELEPRFFDLGTANIAKWVAEYRDLPGFGPWAMMVNGDSRQLLSLLPAQAGAVVSSPPYAETLTNGRSGIDKTKGVDPRKPDSQAVRRLEELAEGYGTTPGQLAAIPVGAVISSPPFHDSLSNKPSVGLLAGSGGRMGASCKTDTTYGEAEGQLGSMSVGAVISSPPYATGDSAGPESLQRRTDVSAQAMQQAEGWKTGGQVSPDFLASMAISSPPYADGTIRKRETGKEGFTQGTTQGQHSCDAYGASEGQLGNMPAAVALSGGFLCQCAKIAEQLSHEDRAGACPAEVSTVVSPSPSAMAVDAPLVATPISAASVAPETTVKSSKGKHSRLHTAQNSALLHEAENIQTRPRQRSAASTSTLKPNARPTPRTGADLDSDDYANVSCSETISNASDAKRTVGVSPSITSKMLQRQEASGTTAPTICNRCAGFVISSSTQQPFGHALNAGLSSPEPACGVASARPHVGSNDVTAMHENAESANTFWQASRLIVQQTFELLTPNGHCIWVLKDYVKNKKIVPFALQWRLMCEEIGFTTLHEHHAMLVEEHGTQEGLFGESTEYKTERKSFFRRLAEKRGSPRIDYETVFCMVKR